MVKKVLVPALVLALLFSWSGEAFGAGLMKRGDSSAEVLALQTALKRLGYDAGPLDGVFGPLTEKGVKTLQKNMGLMVDGVVGDRTRLALIEPPSKPSGIYTVRAGDTLASIAQRYGLTPTLLASINSINGDMLYIGQALSLEPDSKIQVVEETQIAVQGPKIALTFNDGPFPGTTPRILDILKEHDVKATFFVVGSLLESQPGIASRIVQEGHSLANHTYSHHTFERFPKEEIKKQIDLTESVISRYQPSGSQFFRPPHGFLTTDIREIAKSAGLKIVLWSHLGVKDYPAPKVPADWVRQLQLKENSVIMLHDGLSFTLEVLPLIIQTVKKEGSSLVTLSQAGY